MLSLRKKMIFKVISIVLVSLFIIQGECLLAFQDVLKDKYEKAEESYLAKEYETAKNILDNLITELEGVSDRETLRGEACLLLGAVYENLDYRDLAIKYYCLAKKILGDGETIEVLDLKNLKYYHEKCEFVDAYITKFNEGRNKYFAGDYEGSKIIFGVLITDLTAIRGREVLKGETSLLMGATYEKLKYKKLAIKYYCIAKNILGKGKTVEGLELKKLKYYKKRCKAGVVIVPGKKKRGGGIIGLIIGLALLGGLVWYLFINKNSPLKKKEEQEVTVTWSYACFPAFIKATTHSTWDTTNRPMGKVELVPDFGNTNRPYPNNSNNLDDEFTYELKETVDGDLISASVKFELWVYGSGGYTRSDRFWLNDVLKVDKSKTYNNTCAQVPVTHDQWDYYNIGQKNGLGNVKLRYKIAVTKASKSALKNINCKTTFKYEEIKHKK